MRINSETNLSLPIRNLLGLIFIICTGLFAYFDIVIVDKNGKIQLIDIKTNTYRKNNRGKSLKDKPKGSYKINRSPTKQQKKLGIKLMMVDYDW